jgi:aryl-alcohol dehydrogenase-like predicted oxidoreductase
MKHISLGGLDVSRIGLGTMAMSGYYLDPESSDAESIRTIQRALELGVTHIDTAEIYGPYANEELVGRALTGRRDQVVVATKFGLVSHAGAGPGVTDSSPANIRTAVEGSLKRLQTDRIDLYYYSPLGHGFLKQQGADPLSLADEHLLVDPNGLPLRGWQGFLS